MPGKLRFLGHSKTLSGDQENIRTEGSGVTEFREQDRSQTEFGNEERQAGRLPYNCQSTAGRQDVRLMNTSSHSRRQG